MEPPSVSSLTYKGSIPEAILESQRQKKLFLVYISGLDDESTRLESDTWTDAKVAETVLKYCIFLHMSGGTTEATNFSAIYPQKSVPSIVAVGYKGVQLWQSEGFIEAKDLASNLEKAWLSLHIQETTAAVLTGALYSNSRSQNSGLLERGGSSDAVIVSSATDIHRTSAQPEQQTQSEKMEEKNGHGHGPLDEETTAAVHTGALYSNSRSQNIGLLERGGSSDAVIVSSATDIHRTSAQPEQQTQSEKMEEKNGHGHGPPDEEMTTGLGGVVAVNSEQVRNVEDEEGSHCNDSCPASTQYYGPEDHSVVSGSKLEPVSAYNKSVDDRSGENPDSKGVDVLDTEWRSGVELESEVNKTVQDEKAKSVNDMKDDNMDNKKGAAAPSDASLSIRLPSGVTLQETFLLTTTLGMVKDYIDSKACAIGNYNLAIPYPRKVFHDQDLSKSLAELNLLNRQALIVVPREIATKFYRAERAIAANNDSSETNNSGYFAYVKRMISFINPLSYLGRSASSPSSGHGGSGIWEYNPNTGARNNIGRTDGAPSSYFPGQSTSSASSKNDAQRTTPRSGSNIHFLKHDEDDSQFRDRNSFWNGNSTQYGGDNDAR